MLALLQTSVQQYEEQNTKIKQLLVKTKKELADSKQAVCFCCCCCFYILVFILS